MFSQRASLRTPLRIAAALGLVGAITLVCFHIPSVNATTVALSYLLAVLFIATWWSLLEAVVAAVAAVLCFNYFFLPPTGTFTIAEPQNWVALAAFLITAVIASHLSATAKRRTDEALHRRAEIERLYNLSRALMLLEGPPEAMPRQIAGQVASVFDLEAVAVFDKRTGVVQVSGPENLRIPEGKLRDAALQNTVLKENEITILPIRLGGSPTASLGVLSRSISDTALHSIANLVAIALERTRSLEMAGRAEAARQSQELKSTLLDAVAHEFKTPLTSVKAAVSALLSALPVDPTTTELLTVINEETDRMSTMVSEAIEMARIEGGDVHIHSEPQRPAGLISSAVRKIEPALDGRGIETEVDDALPECEADPAMIQNVIVLLLDNALKYSGPNGPIRLSAELQGDSIVFTVADEGPGIPEAEHGRVFEKFYRCARDRRRIPGTGMGLAIARGIVEAHGGRIWVESNPREGARFRFALPKVEVKNQP